MPRSTSFVFLVDLKSSQEELRWHWCTDFFHMFFSLPFDCSSPCSKFVLYFSLLSSPRIWSRLSSPWRRKKGNWIGLQKSKSMPTNLNVIISYRWFFLKRTKRYLHLYAAEIQKKRKEKRKIHHWIFVETEKLHVSHIFIWKRISFIWKIRCLSFECEPYWWHTLVETTYNLHNDLEVTTMKYSS